MKARTLLCSLVIASLGAGTAAFAQPRRDDNGRGNDARQEQRDNRNGRNERNDRNDRNDQNNGRSNNREEHRFYDARSPEFHRGGRLPNEYRNRQYVVNDWRGHHLSAPPRGYQWVQVGPDYVLAAVATGLIANLILNR
jgi:Ni/Co efflux regulator RcnB